VTRTRPRYGRLGAAGSAVAVTLVAVLGGIGVLPDGGRADATSGGARSGSTATLATVTVPDPGPSVTRKATRTPTPGTPTAGERLPADTGTGRRVVFDISDQRVWLVAPDPDAHDEVLRTYLVSGSLTDNLAPGSYHVYSRSRWAVGIDDSGVMEYFVRFTPGANAAIGFHSIPVKDGRPLQTRAQLGTPMSHGCIRQALPDAKVLWDFAPVGTKVVVTA
jgi:L,D-transpeptidase catalytic domain